MAAKKLGQPVPLSYFISEVKSGKPQPTQVKIPGRFSLFNGLVPGRSVPSSRKTLNSLGPNRLRHSSLDNLSCSLGNGTFTPSARSAFQFFCSASTSFIDTGCAADKCPFKADHIPPANKLRNKPRRVIIPPFIPDLDDRLARSASRPSFSQRRFIGSTLHPLFPPQHLI